MTDLARCRLVRYWTEKGEPVALQTPWPLHLHLHTTESARWQATLNAALEGYKGFYPGNASVAMHVNKMMRMIGVCTALNLFKIR